MSAPELPPFDQLMKPTLETLAQLGRSGTVEEINDAVSARLRFSQAQMDEVHPKAGIAVLPNRLAWARTYLKMAGLVANERRGVYTLSDAGHEALTLGDTALRQKVMDAKRTNAALIAPAEPEVASSSVGEDQPTWQTRLIKAILAMKPDAFERLCKLILRANGFARVDVTGRSGDGGIDGTGVLRVNLVSFHVIFQCKKWQKPVGSAEIRDFRGAMMGRAEKGLVFTTSTFTSAAKDEAARSGALPIDLVDGEALCELLKDLRLGVSVRQVEEVEIEPKFFQDV